MPSAGLGREQVGGAEQDFGVDGQAVELEDVFRDGGREDAGLGVLVPRRVGGDEMGDDVDPFLVPGQHAAPHLVRLKGLDFAPEATMRAAEDDHQFPLGRHAVRARDDARGLAQRRNALSEETGQEVDPGHVQIGEKGRVGFVEIVVALQDRGARGCHDGLK